MNRKHIIRGVIVVLVATAGIVAFMKLRGESSTPADDETTPTVVSVQTGALKIATLHRYVEGYGTIEPAPPATRDGAAADAPLAAPTAGVATRVNVIEGQAVNKGDMLVELNSGSTTCAFAEQELARQRKLYAQQNTSLKSLQDAESQLALLRITAPFSGTVVHVNVKPGQAVDVNTVVVELMDLDRLAVSAEMPSMAAGLKAGEELQVMTDPRVTTTLAYVSPAVNKDNDTILVRGFLPGGGTLRPGQFVPLRIVTEVHTNCLAAPAESVVTDEQGRSVVALVNADEAVQTAVQTGLREDGWVEVAAPELKAGDVIVTSGAYGLPAQTKIRVQNPASDEAPSTHSPDAR